MQQIIKQAGPSIQLFETVNFAFMIFFDIFGQNSHFQGLFCFSWVIAIFVVSITPLHFAHYTDCTPRCPWQMSSTSKVFENVNKRHVVRLHMREVLSPSFEWLQPTAAAVGKLFSALKPQLNSNFRLRKFENFEVQIFNFVVDYHW